MPVHESAKLSDIQVLRGIAVLLVVTQHLDALFQGQVKNLTTISHYLACWGGVDLFFVISGFVISQSTHRQQKIDGKYLARFWIRRIFRLLPTLYFSLALTLICSSSMGNGHNAFGSFAINQTDALYTVLNIANIHFWLCQTGQHSCGPNWVYWSLSLEQQFYLVLPFLLLTPRKWLIVLLIAIIAIQFPIDRLTQPLAAFTRTDGLAWGILLATLSTYTGYRRFAPAILLRGTLRRYFTLLTAISLLLALADHPDKIYHLWPISTGLMIMLCGSLVYLASLNQNYILPNGLTKKLLQAIGERSYSIYLLHLPAFFLAREIIPILSGWTPNTHNALQLALTSCILLVILVEFSFRLIEAPGIQFGRKLALKMAHTPNAS